MERTTTAVLIFIGIAIISISSIYVIYKISLPPTSQPDAEITYFSLNGYDNPVGTVWNYKFILKVFNNASTPINGLTVTFNITNGEAMNRTIELYKPPGGPSIISITPGESYPLDTINAGETTEVYGLIWNNLLDCAKLRGTNFVATIKLNGIILDERSIPL
jgi:hypothetical protein